MGGGERAGGEAGVAVDCEVGAVEAAVAAEWGGTDGIIGVLCGSCSSGASRSCFFCALLFLLGLDTHQDT